MADSITVTGSAGDRYFGAEIEMPFNELVGLLRVWGADVKVFRIDINGAQLEVMAIAPPESAAQPARRSAPRPAYLNVVK